MEPAGSHCQRMNLLEITPVAKEGSARRAFRPALAFPLAEFHLAARFLPLR